MTEGVCAYVDEQNSATKKHRRHKKLEEDFLCFVAVIQSLGVRGFVLSPAATVGNGGKLSPSFAEFINGVAPCRLPSSNRLNSASSLSASSFFFNREYARNN